MAKKSISNSAMANSKGQSGAGTPAKRRQSQVSIKIFSRTLTQIAINLTVSRDGIFVEDIHIFS